MILKSIKIAFFGVKTQDFFIFYATLKWMSLRNGTKSVNHYSCMGIRFAKLFEAAKSMFKS